MKIKKFFKWLIYFGLGSAVISSMAVFADSIMKTNNQVSFANDSESISKSRNAVSYQMRANPIINLDSSFNAINFSTLDDKLSSGINAIRLKEKIKEELTKSSYWLKNEIPNPTEFDIEIVELIDNYNNPLLNTTLPAVKITPSVSGQKLNQTIVTLTGLETNPSQPTFAIDIFAKNYSSDNKTASLIYTNNISKDVDGKKLAPSDDNVKEYFIDNKEIFQSLFVNLPNLSTTGQTNTSDGNFTLSINDGVEIKRSGSSDGTIEGNYVIYDYSVILKASYVLENGYVTPSSSDNAFNLKLYVPNKAYANIDAKNNTIIHNVVVANDGTKSANEFDKERISDPVTFRKNILDLLKDPKNSVALPDDIIASEIDVKVASTLNGNYLYSQYGMVVYSVTVKRVNIDGKPYTDEANWITQDIIFTGFNKVIETKYLNTLTITDTSLSNHYASEFSTLNNENGKDVLSEMAKNDSQLFYYTGSYKVEGTGRSKLFKSDSVIVNYTNASYNDRTGTISNINVSIIGYYDANGTYQSSEANAKQMTLTINGFKTNDVSGVTTINVIDAPNVYTNYPAQSFAVYAIGEKSEVAQQLEKGWLPTKLDFSEEGNPDKINEIKNLILEYVNNLPDISGNEKENWKLKDITINNFVGTVTGKVLFPYFYELNSYAEPVIKKQNPDKEIWIDFTIQGFSEVSGATTVNNLFTNKYVKADEFDVMQQHYASLITLNDFANNVVPQENEDKEKYFREAIKYWVINQQKIVTNRWATFNKQFVYESTDIGKYPNVGMQEFEFEIDNEANQYSILFNFYRFDSNGNYILPEDKTKIVITDFKQEPQAKASTINDKYPLSASYLGKLQNAYAEDLSNLLKAGSGTLTLNEKVDGKFTTLTYEEVIKILSDGITSKLAQNIKQGDQSPKYLFKEPIYDYNDNPTSIKVKVSFVNNYYNDSGEFITTETPTNKWYEIEISNLLMKGNTSISNLISVANNEEFQNNDGKMMLASEAAKTKSTQIQSFIKSNIINQPIDVEGGTTVLYFKDEDGTIPGENQNIGGVEYFGLPNDIEGTITLYIRFGSGSWVKDGNVVTSNSEVKIIILTGFQKGETITDWYNNEFSINTSRLTSNVGDDIASAVINGDKDIYGNTIEGMKSQDIILEDLKQRLKDSPSFLVRDSNTGSYVIPQDSINTLQILPNESTADNANGTILLTLSIYGAGIVDPNTGLKYESNNNPYKFKVLVSGFYKVKPTRYSSNIYIDNVSSAPAPSVSTEIKNQLTSETSLNNLFGGTLPPGFKANLNQNMNDYFEIAEAADNFNVDYANGETVVKEMKLGYYFDENYNLICKKVPSSNRETTDIHQYLIMNEVSFSGYARMQETQVIQTVTLTDYANITATDFLKSVNNDIIHGLIYNNKNDSTSEDELVKPNPDLPSINNLSKFLTNYSLYAGLNPVLSLKKGTTPKIDNISGTITFDLVVNGNYFYFNTDTNKIDFVNYSINKDKPMDAVTVTVYGFKKLSATSVTSRINISQLIANNSDPELLKNRQDLFWYNIKNPTDKVDDQYIFAKYKIVRLIIENYNLIFKNPYKIEELINAPNIIDPNLTQAENQKKYLDSISSYLVIEFDSQTSNFKNGTLNVKIKLNQYVSSDGEIVTSSDLSETVKPFETTISIIGFSITNETSAKNIENDENTGVDFVIVDVNQYLSLKTMDFFCTVDQLTEALIATGLDEKTKNSILLSNTFYNLPPNTIFEFLNEDGTALKDVSEIANIQHFPGLNPYVTFSVKLSNILVSDDSNQSVFIGDKAFNIKLTGFDSNVETTALDEWNLSIKYADLAQNIKDFTKEGLTAGLNQLNSQGEQLWTSFVTNPVRDGNGQILTTLEVTEVIEANPSDGKAKVKIKLGGWYYDKTGQKIQGEKEITHEITILGLNVQSPTSVVVDSFKLQELSTTINLLPSELIKGTSEEIAAKKNLLIGKLNTYTVKKYLFLNPYITSNGEGSDPVIETEITGINIDSIDDGAGSVRLSIEYQKYYDSTGTLQLTGTQTTQVILITGLNQVNVTSKGSSTIDLDTFFKGFALPTDPANFPNMTPSEYLREINRQLELLPKDKSLEKFNEIFAQLIAPVYRGSLRTQIDSEGNLAPYTSATDTNLASSGIINLGKEMTWELEPGSNKYVLSPIDDKTQELSSIQTSIDYHLKEVDGGLEYNVEDIIRANDRLGQLSFTLKVRGFWTLTFDGKNNVLDKTTKQEQKIDISLYGGSTNGSLQKDVSNETNLTVAAIVGVSAGIGVISLIILFAYLIKLLRFGTGGS